eukprot:COSAG01_NODE_6349_length_3720_cov_32.132836_2_plen_88_part_00
MQGCTSDSSIHVPAAGSSSGEPELTLSHFGPDESLLWGVSILCSLPAAASSSQQHPAAAGESSQTPPCRPPRQAMMLHLLCHRATAS